MSRISQASQGLVSTLASDAFVEIIPMQSAATLLAPIPADTPLTITCSQKLGLEALIGFVAAATAAGFTVTPHLAARQIQHKAHLQSLLARLGELGITNIFVIGGDLATPVGNYTSAVEVLRDMTTFAHSITRIGVGCYPEGHPHIDDAVLLQALRDKQQYADYMVNQICFDPQTVIDWLGGVRDAGITLPLYLGLPAPMKTTRLISLGLKIGVGQSLKFLTRQEGLLRRIVTGNTYEPDTFLQHFPDELVTRLDIAQVHVFSFNQIDATVDWQARLKHNRVT